MNAIQVHKFGGASVKDADGVRNLLKVLQGFQSENLCVVLSAMGKTTNALERLCKSFFNKSFDTESILLEVKEYHNDLIKELFPSGNDELISAIENIYAELHWAIEEDQIKSYDYEYDQIVSQGEQLSTRIVASYLNSNGFEIDFIDARDLLRTDNTYREAKVEWLETNSLIHSNLKFSNSSIKRYLTQGFIGGTSENFTTTLGREGSDYTASIIAYCLNAKEVIIWKDVPGVLNADPKEWGKATLIDELSYFDAIELTYYGATVIHPKTIKPLQNKLIPLRVKSFLNPNSSGTLIRENKDQKRVTSYIFKKQQYLLSISTRDFSFIVEENLEEIFKAFNKSRVKINLMQQAALTFSVCLSAEEARWTSLLQELQTNYKVKYNDDCELITVRHYSENLPEEFAKRGAILLEQRSRHTLQYVIKSN
ncbi:MAG: aspartate kinase [Bacteroidia bacterium]